MLSDRYGCNINILIRSANFFSSPYATRKPVCQSIIVSTAKGRIHHNKGIHHIINAWILLKNQYTDTCPPLWIVGGTPVEINEFHLEHNLHLAPVIMDRI